MSLEEDAKKVSNLIEGREGEQIFIARVHTDYNYHRIPNVMYPTLMYLGVLDSDKIKVDERNVSENFDLFDITPINHHKQMIDAEDEFPALIFPVSKWVVKKTHIREDLPVTTSHDSWDLKWACEKERVKINPAELPFSEDYSFLLSEDYFRDLVDKIDEEVLHFQARSENSLLKVGAEEIRNFFEKQRVHEVSEYEQALRILNSTI